MPKKQTQPQFFFKYVKFDHNSKYQKAIKRKIFEIENNKHYKNLSEFDLTTYKLHLKLSNELGSYIWENLEDNLFDLIKFHSLKKKFE